MYHHSTSEYHLTFVYEDDPSDRDRQGQIEQATGSIPIDLEFLHQKI